MERRFLLLLGLCPSFIYPGVDPGPVDLRTITMISTDKLSYIEKPNLRMNAQALKECLDSGNELNPPPL